jgi:hypothetical protein
MYVSRRYNVSTNKFGVKAGQDQVFWEQHGWINAQDPRGWFQWCGACALFSCVARVCTIVDCLCVCVYARADLRMPLHARYCRFYMGRRTDDDARQISRWSGVTGAKGRWKRALLNKIVAANARWDDATVSPVIRQTLLHWCVPRTAARSERAWRERCCCQSMLTPWLVCSTGRMR